MPNENVENTLIANTGLHFKTKYVTFNPEEPLLLPNGKTLKYTFIQTFDFNNNLRIRVDVCSQKDGQYVPVNHVMDHKLYDELPSGLMKLDATGLPIIKEDTVMTLAETYQQTDPDLININSLRSYRIKRDHDTENAFDLLLGKWLPMPMFEIDHGNVSMDYPLGWCRVKIDPVSEPRSNGEQEFRLTWAFDTTLGRDPFEGILRPSFLEGSGDSKQFAICNRPDLLMGGFLNIPDGENDAPIGDYLVSLLGLDLKRDIPQKYKFIGYYVYLINYLRLSGASPVVTLYNRQDGEIPVDMSVDIGNSRTCCVLFENGDFTKARMLRLRDLSEPHRSYENAFDMRIVFRKADIGGDITLGKDLFRWPSLVRVGEEAKNLIYRSLENTGVSKRTTNYSSPKRYLWDDQPFKDRWEFMVIKGDPTNVKEKRHISIQGFTDHFDDDGTFLETPKELDIFNNEDDDKQCHYSRRSLMTFVMIEMLQQAQCYINSSKFRAMHGQIDCRRYLRSIIVTCPTAMPLEEQKALRQAALDASKLMTALNPSQPELKITPEPSKIRPFDDPEDLEKRGWLYDEAFASQLVYLYAELERAYGGKVDQMFDLKGHVRKDMEERGFQGKSLTIGTIDIGAGTTDVMITSYGRKGPQQLTPVPLYYDSFYTAGDDIVHNVIRDIILEGPMQESDDLGSINSALNKRIQTMTPDELLTIPRIADTKLYQNSVDKIKRALTEDESKALRNHLTFDLMHHFFGEDSALMSERDREVREDFCTQVSVPMAQFFMELLRENYPSKTYTYDEIFPNEKPSDYIMDHFAYHFGYRFESLKWRFDPQAIASIVRETMESLIKALSVVIYAYNCDILVLSGRPTNLEALTELFLKYIPISPSRLVRLNQYRVGNWFPLATGEGYFQENQKAIVAVGAEVGLLASTVGFNGLVLDFSVLSKTMKSTARYMGMFDERLSEVASPYLTPTNSSVSLRGLAVFPYYIGCKQFNSAKYPARPIYVINNNSGKAQLDIMLQRSYVEDREKIEIEDITDMDGNSVNRETVDIHLQTIAGDGNFWMDEGSFTLRIQEM